MTLTPPLESHSQFELHVSANLSLRMTLTVHGDLFVISACHAGAHCRTTIVCIVA